MSMKQLFPYITSIVIIFVLSGMCCDVSASTEMQSERVFTVSMDKSGSVFSLKTIDVNFGAVKYETDFGNFKKKYSNNYNGTVVDIRGGVIAYFIVNNLESMACNDSIGQDGRMTRGCFVSSSGGVRFLAPYFNNAGRVEMYDDLGNKLFSVDVSKYSVCNMNGACETPREDSVRCPSECTQQDDIRMHAQIQADVDRAEKHEAAGSWLKNFGLLSGAAVLIAGTIYMIVRRYRSLRKYGMFK